MNEGNPGICLGRDGVPWPEHCYLGYTEAAETTSRITLVRNVASCERVWFEKVISS